MELRPLSCRQGLLQRADGSCHWKQGKTEVVAGVYGPVEPKGGRKEDESKAELKLLYFPCVGFQNPHTTAYQYYLQNLFEEIILLSLHPKSLIEIVVHVLCEDGSVFPTSLILPKVQELSACCNAITMALIDAGIEIKTILASVDVIVLENNQIFVDLPSKCLDQHSSWKERAENESAALAVSSFQMTSDGKITSEWVRSLSGAKALDHETYLKSREVAILASTKLHYFFENFNICEMFV